MFSTKINEVLASKNSLRSFAFDRLNFISFGACLLINIIHWLLLYIKIGPGNHRILLQYNVIYSSGTVDYAYYAYAIPGIALGLLILNFGVSYYFYSREKLASYFLDFAGIPVQAVFLVASVVVTLINA